MATKKMSGDNNATIRFAVENYFDGNISQAAQRTGYTQNQIKKWINDEILGRSILVRYYHAGQNRKYCKRLALPLSDLWRSSHIWP